MQTPANNVASHFSSINLYVNTIMCVVHSPLNGGSADQQANRVILPRYLATTSVPT